MTLICLGQCGYDLYAEIHQNYYNQLIHGLFMPLVVYGTFLGFPALLGTLDTHAYTIQLAVYCFYVGYYMLFDPVGALMSIALYTPVYYLAGRQVYKATSRWRNVTLGLAWIFAAVGIHEFFVHA